MTLPKYAVILFEGERKIMSYYSRKSPRLPQYDYTNENYYFVTICTHEKKCLFGLPKSQTNIGKLAQKHLNTIFSHYSCVKIDKFVVMPNHVHMIVVLEKGQVVNLTQIIGQYKSGVTREARKIMPELTLWQRSFHDHVIRNQKAYESIWTYIENNPEKWEEDCFWRSKDSD